MSKKVLVITYYWPPSAGGGVQRWLKFVKYLPDYGWEPIVFTPEDPDFGIQDESLELDVPHTTEVIHFPIWEPTQKLKSAKTKQGVVASDQQLTTLGKLMIWLRGNLIVPDPKRFWVKPSVGFLQSYIEQNQIDAVVTTGPPHSLHLIGLELKKKTEIKWIADFRDPWSDWDILDELKTSAVVKKLHRRLERQVMRMTDRVLACTPAMADLFRAKNNQYRVEMITNGVDGRDFLNYQSDASSSGKFIISHMGLLNDMRNPRELWVALTQLCAEEQGFAEDLQIFLSGMISDGVLQQLESSSELSKCLCYEEYLSHDQVVEQYERSGLLLLLMNQSDNADLLIPGKLFEYLYAERDVLAFGTEQSDVHQILTDSGLEGVVNYSNQEQIKTRVKTAYQRYKSGRLHVPVSNKTQWERRNLTQGLASILDQITD
ncbi:glycosyltransferase [Reichenbachiella agariperforans]|uniref:glycosyltransferase n=1 Tax=Reichenbachiella agariperforans TaxID=156994 RepID=UPI001C0A0E5E|nr:glycosyltransferase [Reichenbachiella agariperforans]MBU2914833.1 glycosyltransferase [Reichenbachiella agariperforans]